MYTTFAVVIIYYLLLSALKLYLYPIHDAIAAILEPLDEEADHDAVYLFDHQKRLGKSGAEAAEAAEELRAIQVVAKYIGDEALDSAFNRLVYGVTSNIDDEGAILKNVKGTIFWKSQLDKYIQSTESLDELYAMSLDEKRNFLTFALTMTTIIFMPLNVMTGYWVI